MCDCFAEIARRERLTIDQIASVVTATRQGSGLTAKLRVFSVDYFRAASTEAGHAHAGHGQSLAGIAAARVGVMKPEGPAQSNALHRCAPVPP